MAGITVRQMPSREIGSRRMCSTRRIPPKWLILFYSSVFGPACALVMGFGLMDILLFIGISAVLPFALWLLYLLAYGANHYKVLAEDGLYVVKDGLATHIPWEAVDGAQVKVMDFYSSIRLQFKAGLVDDVTGRTPMMDETDNTFPFSRAALQCIQRHVEVVAVPRDI